MKCNKIEESRKRKEQEWTKQSEKCKDKLKLVTSAMKECNLDMNWDSNRLQVVDLHCDDNNEKE